MSVVSLGRLEGLKRAARVVAETLRVVRRAVATGVTTAELDRLAAAVFAERGARSGPILTYGYPGSICVSVDEEVVHGVPGSRALRDGELVTFNWAAPSARTRLTPGLVFTIEPMVTAGMTGILVSDDGWTACTADRSPSAHEEHTIMVAPDGPLVLTRA